MSLRYEDLKGDTLISISSRLVQGISHKTKDGCIIWGMKPNVHGYGQMSVETDRGKTVAKVHRITWMLFHKRDTLPGTHIDHSCREKLCINHYHLREVSAKENSENVSNKTSNATGHKNVYKHSAKGFYVRLSHHGKSVYGGYFLTLEEAVTKAKELRLNLYTNNLDDRK